MRIATTSRCLLCLLPLCLLLESGCRSRSDLVEAELRTKDRMLRETKEELDRARMMNEALERDYVRRQQGLPPAENSGLLCPKDITLGRGTGGVDDDRVAGDEALQVVVVPRDEDGNPVRAAGALTVTAWEILPGGVKIPLSTWEVNSLDVRRTWKSGLLGSGYFVLLHWKKLPTQDRLRIVAQLALPDGRVYEADKDISIRPLKPIAPPGEKMPLIPSTPPDEKMPLIPSTIEPGPLIGTPPAQIVLPQPSITNPIPPPDPMQLDPIPVGDPN